MLTKLSLINILDSCKYSIDSIAFSPCGQYLSASSNNNILIYHLQTRLHLTTLNENGINITYRVIIWVDKHNDNKINKKLSDYRLITIGLHGIITDWNLNTLQSENKCSSYGGAIFTGVKSCDDDYILVGCDDGCVRRFRLWDCEDKHFRVPTLCLDDVRIRHDKSILSVCLLSDGTFFCGTSDSIIYHYKCLTEIGVIRLNTPVLDDSANDGVCIWSLAYLEKLDRLVSGDSNGNVVIWDVNTYTMVKQFNQHDLDVLSLCIGNEGDVIYSAGIDGKFVVYSFSNKNGWYMSSIKYLNRYNSNIRSMVIHPHNNFIATAGTDGIISLVDNNKCKLILSNLPSWINSSIDMSRNKNLVLCKYLYHCDIWFIPPYDGDNISDLVSVSLNDNNSISNDSQAFHSNKTHTKLDLKEVASPKTHDKLRLTQSSNFTPEDKYQGSSNSDSLMVTNLVNGNSRESANKNAYTSLSAQSTKYLESETLRSSCPYKLAMIKLNKDGDYIGASKISPEGDVIAIVNQKGLMILNFNMNDLNIERRKLKHTDLIISSMDFISNDELIICHYVGGCYNISVYNIKTDSIARLDVMEHITRKIIKFKVYSKFIICYSIDGNVYVIENCGKKSANKFIELPQFENEWKITCVTTSPDNLYLVIFSNTFRYYFYNTKTLTIVPYDDVIIHNIPNKLINHNTIVYNAIWLNEINRIIVQTNNHIISITVDDELFHKSNTPKTHTKLDRKEVASPKTHDKLRLTQSSNFTPEDKYQGSSNSDSLMVTNLVNGNSRESANKDDLCYENGLGTTQQVHVASKRKRVYIGPRHLYNVPKKANSIFNPLVKLILNRQNIVNNIKEPTDDTTRRYNCIKKIKFIVHMDIRFEGDLMNILVFHMIPANTDFINRKHYGN